MSEAQSLLESLTLQGVDLWADGEQLRYRGPKTALTPERLNQLKQHKTALLQHLATTTYKPAREQQRAWATYQAAPQKAAHHVTFAAHLRGPLATAAFQRAWQTLVQRHAALRTTYDAQQPQTAASATGNASNGAGGREPNLLATVHGAQGLTVAHVDAQGWREQELLTQLAVHQARPFDLAQGPLLRVTLFARAAQEQILLAAAPRIALDDSSLARLLDELGRLYAAAQQGVALALPAPKAAPAEYAAWQAAQRQQAPASAGRDEAPPFSAEELVLNLPVDHPRRGQQPGRLARQPLQFSARLIDRLRGLAAQAGAALDAIFLAALQVLLHRYTGQDALLVGVTLDPRRRSEFADLVGGFAVDVALPTELTAGNGDGPAFTDLLAQSQRRLQAAARQGGALDYAPQAAFTWVEASQQAADQPRRWGSLQVTPLALEAAPELVELRLEAAATEAGVSGAFAYRSDLFAPDTILRLAGHFQTLLAGIADDPSRPIGQLPLLAEAERRQILVEWNDSATDYPRNQGIHELVEAQAARTPDALAVVFDSAGADGEGAPPATLTYRELNARANQLAHHLQTLGVGPGTLVGLCVERSAEMVTAMLAILKAGGAYAPLDVTYPQKRLAFMLEDTQAPVLLTQQRFAHLFAEAPVTVVSLDAEWEAIASHPDADLPTETSAAAPAYIIYTSGSTGIPKGATIPHRAINRLLINTNYIDIRPTDRIAQASNASFDAATFEVWGALAHGATLVGVPREVALVPQDFAAYLRRQEISVLFLTTALFNQIVRAAPDAFATLRYLLFGGEAVDPTAVRIVLQQGAPAHLLHVYGPTESTTFSTWHPVHEVPAEAHTVPIGGPLANTQLYVLDRYLQPAPVNVPGELYIGGDGLAIEYHNRPQLTAEKFIANPYGPGRLYKTGDLVRWLPEGDIEFLGRIDTQVKLRGFRIELGEVEAALTTHPAVQDAVAVLREDRPGDKRLVAYVVARSEEQGASIAHSAATLRDYLQQKLPDYMIPAAFVSMDALPLNLNGKVDRKALPLPEAVAEPSATEIVQPRNPIEAVIAHIWCETMNRTQVGVHDNFMDLGGHSLQATQIIAKLRSTFQVQFPLSRFFEASTVAEMAQLLVEYERKPGQIAKLARLQQRLSQL